MWYNIEDENKDKVCNFSKKGWEELQEYAKEKGYTRMGNYYNHVPLMYQLITGTVRGYDCFGGDVVQNSKELDYPLIDHAFCLRDDDDNIIVMSNSYTAPAGLNECLYVLKLLYPLMDVVILDRHFYSSGTVSIVFKLKDMENG